MNFQEKSKKIDDLFHKEKLHRMVGSKSGFIANNPDVNVIFNSYCLIKDDHGLLQMVRSPGDMVLSDKETLDSLKRVCNELKCDIYFYSEGTVHNETFNGRLFPYDNWSACVKYYGKNRESEVVVRLSTPFQAKLDVKKAYEWEKTNNENLEISFDEFSERVSILENLNIVAESGDFYVSFYKGFLGDVNKSLFDYYPKEVLIKID